MKNPREMIMNTNAGIQEIVKTNGEQLGAFGNFAGSVFKPGALDTKTKELISIGITVHTRCEYCIVEHTRKALEAGATREEIIEAAMTAAVFGGGPALTYIANVLIPSINEFAPEFNK